MSSLNDLKASLDKLIEYHSKLIELAASEGAENKTIEIGGAARVIAYHANDIFKIAQSISNLAMIKEQADFAAEQQPQKAENFLAALQNRKPNKIARKR